MINTLQKITCQNSTTPELLCDNSALYYQLCRILASDLENIEIVLGKFGTKLKAFADAIDLKHPHAKKLFDNMLSDDFGQYVVELLELVSFAKKQKLTRILPNISKIISKEQWLGLRPVDSPFNTNQYIRLLPTKKERDKVRSCKKMQVANNFIKNLDKLWEVLPSKFDSFVRLETVYHEEIELALKKAQRYTQLGCSGMAKQILESIEKFKSQTQETYYGFNRITVTNASVILAKYLGYKLTLSENDVFRITIPRDMVKDLDFNPAPKNYDYQPRVYPLCKLDTKLLPDYFEKIVDHLECFPEVGSKSIFDNYIVLVPGVLNSSEGATPLVNMQYVLLGEVDGKCFFIC